MTHTVRIDCAQKVDGDELLAAFAAEGLEGTLVRRDPRLVFQLGDAGHDAKRFAGDVTRALDTWIAKRRMPLVPVALGNDAFVLRPPSA